MRWSEADATSLEFPAPSTHLTSPVVCSHFNGTVLRNTVIHSLTCSMSKYVSVNSHTQQLVVLAEPKWAETASLAMQGEHNLHKHEHQINKFAQYVLFERTDKTQGVKMNPGSRCTSHTALHITRSKTFWLEKSKNEEAEVVPEAWWCRDYSQD